MQRNKQLRYMDARFKCRPQRNRNLDVYCLLYVLDCQSGAWAKQGGSSITQDRSGVGSSAEFFNITESSLVFVTGSSQSQSAYNSNSMVSLLIDNIPCATDRAVNTNDSYQYASATCIAPLGVGQHVVSVSFAGGGKPYWRIVVMSL